QQLFHRRGIFRGIVARTIGTLSLTRREFRKKTHFTLLGGFAQEFDKGRG
ncbi:hypothetical protein TSAR_000892, partial [Trichomalopsis sarcophagae]